VEKKGNILNNYFKKDSTFKLDHNIVLPYSIPSNYFDEFYIRLLQKINHHKTTNNNLNQVDYFIPDGYFNKFSELILKETELLEEEDITDELSRIAPIFKDISKQNVYQLPEGYFEKDIETKKLNTSKVYSINNKSLVRWTIAASFIGIMFIGYFLVADKDSKEINNKQNLAFSKKNIDINSSIKKISDDDLTKYINNDYNYYNDDTVILDDVTVPDIIDKKIEAVSDDDLNKYLSDAATLTNIKKGL